MLQLLAIRFFEVTAAVEDSQSAVLPRGHIDPPAFAFLAGHGPVLPVRSQKNCQRWGGDIRHMGMRFVTAGGLAALLAAGAFAQTPEARPAFEAASVKPNTTGSGSTSSNSTRGQIVMVNQSLKRLIERAYDVKPFQVTGPEWMENVRFDVTAKYPPGTESADRPAMLRDLLEDRFKLTTHSESKEMPGYALVVAKNGLKLKPAELGPGGGAGTNSDSSNNLETLSVTTISMAELANFLARRVGSPVADATNVAGVFTFEIHWTLDDPNGDTASAGQFANIQEALSTLGLHLRAEKVPVPIVVVDHVERVPTEN